MAEGNQNEGKSLIDDCYDLVNSFSQDQAAINDASTAGSALAMGVTAVAVAPGVVASPALAGPEAALAILGAHELGPTIGEHGIMPLEATVAFADCLPLNDFAHEVVSMYSEPTSPVV